MEFTEWFEKRLAGAKTIDELNKLQSDIGSASSELYKLGQMAHSKATRLRRKEHAQMLKNWIGETVCINPTVMTISVEKQPNPGQPAKLESVGIKYAVLRYAKPITGYALWKFPILQVVPYEKGMEKGGAEKSKQSQELGRIISEAVGDESA